MVSQYQLHQLFSTLWESTYVMIVTNLLIIDATVLVNDQ